ncbi:MAG: Outer membrane protein assembly factor BamE precursor [Alphaproteobacteria bacterium ADurb.BinA280]|jgi:outer membrane protein assembly factor BamE|nr:outer membrane protein assembly factor BamE [Xanthomonadales bacterium]MCC6505721.1 outer membrane protein assembly factor BamE [Aquimonas sp.]OPZ11657.1 MAG: Outer membrane protein assembly factor BamE precursor [Alphaproteobacteria bacterium ADurb.BinA280]
MRLTALGLFSALLFSGCGIIYKVDVYQGNLLDERNVAQLKTGMSKRQVLSLLGTPAVRDPFHAARWDYVATQSQRGSDTEVKNLSLMFDGDTLTSIEGDYFAKQDDELRKRLARYGNLPKEERNKRGGG